MKITDIFMLMGGLALFLYGMKMMSEGLEATAGNKMKKILEKLTSNRFLGVAVGAGITAVIQSSSATTVMVVGFVNSGIMTLKQAVWVIMGANIGTTITGQLIALDIGMIAPIFAIIGVVMAVFMKNKKVNHLGEIIAGLGILFIGMETMATSMVPLQNSQKFVSLMTQFKNPLIGILAGAMFTAVIQSSSASVGILQALANSGVIGLSSSVYVLFGQNIGTCITAVLASIGTNRNAKRTTLIHLLFNVIGTSIFVLICMTTPFTSFMKNLNPSNPAAQIANVHTVFNIVTTLVLLPFGGLLIKIVKRILPDRGNEIEGKRLKYIDTKNITGHKIGSISIIIYQLQKEIARMYQIVKDNVTLSFESIEKSTDEMLDKVKENEDYIDYLNAEISKFISEVISVEMPENDAKAINAYFKIVGNIERIGDHAMNIAEYGELINGKGLNLSEVAMKEVAEMKKVSIKNLNLINLESINNSLLLLEQVAKAEQHVDDVTVMYRENQLERLKKGVCSGETCVIYAEMLTDFERIGDHLLNIAQEYSKLENCDIIEEEL
ncbi:MAG: Na/Pi cotransporter family protein [Clostridium sp.]|nr:Na/Pi cotransporter family protein [Clostridium sp.]